MLKRASREELAAEIGSWNSRHPVGSEVVSKLYPGRVLKTRTEAMVLFEQKAIIYLDGFNGYFDLNEVWPAAEAPQDPAQADTSTPQPAAQDAGAQRSPATPTGTAAAGLAATSHTRLVAMFPGQGAQNKGMGGNLFAAFPDQTARASEILGYSIEELCLRDPNGTLNQTQFTQPALYVVGALGYLKQCADQAECARADAFMGHSLGEYNALFAAGAFDFETGLRLVKKRGELMAEAGGGAMAAVVRISVARIKEVLASNGLETVDLANFNTPTQTVISGPADAMARAVEMLGKESGVVMPLKVSAAFHSRYMQDASRKFLDFLQDFSFSTLRCPVIANSTARPYAGEAIAETLAAQIASPVLWTDSVRFVLEQGDAEFVEVGSTILSKMVKEIRGSEKAVALS